MIDLERIGADARAASRTLAVLDAAKKNQVLRTAADALDQEENQAAILRGNAEDLAIADQNQMLAGLRDRLRLTEERLHAMADAIRDIVSLEDPVGEVLSETTRPNGLRLQKVAVPIGVTQSIYCDIDVLRAYLKKHAAQGNVLGQPLDKNGNAYTLWVYSSVVVEVGKMEDVEFVVKKLQDMGYQTTNMKEYRDTAMRTVRMLELLLGGIGLISFLVAAIGISNTMTTAVYDRVAEIGTLKVLGCEKRELMAMILLEAGIYGLVGGACGECSPPSTL